MRCWARALSLFVLRRSKDGRGSAAAEGPWSECLTTDGTRAGVANGTGIGVSRMRKEG